MSGAVRATPELARILALPRRHFSNEDLEALADELTALLRTPTGRMRLRRVQALALHDIGTCGGLLGSIGVGEGKTLISLLAAFVLGAHRPMLLLPASLIEGAQRAMLEMRRHWLVPKTLRVFSYEKLGRDEYQNELIAYDPDALICDEVHRLKNRDAAVTKRVSRFMAAKPETPFVGMSGTIMRDSLHDFAHLLRWALKGNAPIPSHSNELDQWAMALDAAKTIEAELEQPDPGALKALTPVANPDISDIRRGFRARLNDTPGVVSTAGEGERVDCSIYLTAHVTKVKPLTEQHFTTLRKKAERPDGKPFERGADIWACARQLALGFHYEWRDPPPEDWLEARKEWSAFVREVLSRSRTLDSPLQVVNAIDAGTLTEARLEEGRELLSDWRAVRDTFDPVTVAVWHDDSILRLCGQWANEPGIIWVEHQQFGERLSRETGLPFFGESGLDKDGVFIEDAEGSIIASIRANRDGKNLQHKWCRNLVVSPPDGWDAWQQLIARTHRPGQKADAVVVDVLWGCLEHLRAWDNALEGTYTARDMTGSDDAAAYKLLLALPDAEIPDTSRLSGYRWVHE
jgi:hypothetical protein